MPSETIIEENGCKYKVITHEDGSVVKHIYHEDEIYELEITSDKNIIDADGSNVATCTCTLYKNGEICTEYDGTPWYIPIVDITGNPFDLIEVTLSNGQATYEFKTNKPGIYTIRLDLIRPKTTATLLGNIEIIARKVT